MPGQLAPQLPIVKKPNQSLYQLRHILTFYHDATRGFARIKNVANTWRIRGDDRQTARHGLERCNRKTLVAGREGVNVSGGKITPYPASIIHELIYPQHS